MSSHGICGERVDTTEAGSLDLNPNLEIDVSEGHGQSFLGQFVDNGRNLSRQREFYLMLGVIGSAPFVFPSTFDNESLALNQRLAKPSRAYDILQYGDWVGQTSLQVGLALVNIGIGELTNSESLRSFGSDIIYAQTYNAVVTLSMKAAINRARPNGSPYSYPSGHTSTSFASAGVVYSHFGMAWGAVAFAGASYVGLSRIAENKHYLSDVVAGAFIGSYIGLRIGRESHSERRFSFAPAIEIQRGAIEYGGLALSVRF